MTTAISTTPEFSRPVDIERLGDAEAVFDIAATEEERAALARRFDWLGLDRLEARVTARRNRGGVALRLSGTLTADLVQACVVTLEPVPGHVEQDFKVRYGAAEAGQEVVLDAEADDPLEPLPEGPLDIGEVVAQELALAVDPYPRAPGALLDTAFKAGETGETPRNSPFAALAGLKKKQKKRKPK